MGSPLFSWSTPPSYWDVTGIHLPLALASGIPLLLSYLIPCDVLPLKPCTFQWLTGYPCPFCGFTRSFWAISEGDWAFSLYNCPLACVVYVASAVAFLWNGAALLFGVRISRGRHLRPRPGQGWWFFGIICVSVALNWVYRLSIGLK